MYVCKYICMYVCIHKCCLQFFQAEIKQLVKKYLTHYVS